MVKLGFIAEGATEKMILEKSDFFNFLRGIGVQFIPEVIDAEGNGNLLPQNITAFTGVLTAKGASHIFIVTDLDDDRCVTSTKNRIAALPGHTVVVSKKAVESWFLADTDAMCNFLGDDTFACDEPEMIDNPYELIKATRLAKNNRGIGTKLILAQLMIRSGFSVVKAARHLKCSSAKYFIEKVEQIALRPM